MGKEIPHCKQPWKTYFFSCWLLSDCFWCCALSFWVKNMRVVLCLFLHEGIPCLRVRNVDYFDRTSISIAWELLSERLVISWVMMAVSKSLGIADFNCIPMHESQGIYNILIVNLILQILILLENYLLATTDISS